MTCIQGKGNAFPFSSIFVFELWRMLNLSLRIGRTRVSIEDVEDGLIDSPKAPLEQDYLTYK